MSAYKYLLTLKDFRKLAGSSANGKAPEIDLSLRAVISAALSTTDGMAAHSAQCFWEVASHSASHFLSGQ